MLRGRARSLNVNTKETVKPTDLEFAEIKEKASVWARERLDDLKTVIIDCETTGILSKDPTTEVVQLAITNSQGKPLFCMLLKPAQPMSEEVVGFHGITNEMVFECPTFPQVAKMISFILEGKHVIAYNADFDIALLVHLFKKYKIDVPKFAGASCCMDKYSEWKGEWNASKQGIRWQKLPNLSGLPAHDALSDCLSTLKVMELMAANKDLSQLSAEEISLDF
jgi:DNA polymerase-3 subunit epsilon